MTRKSDFLSFFSRSKKLFLPTLAAALFCFYAVFSPLVAFAADFPPLVYVTQPWLTSMARFIVGSTMTVQPLFAWSQSGTMLTLRRPSSGIPVIALDPIDASRYGLKRNKKNLFKLYDNLPVPVEIRDTLSFDPAVLPFLSQRLLVALCKLQPENYPFYQRRLAEFQSRLESTLEVGRSLLTQIKMLDLSGACGPWVRAASPGTVQPPADLWREWSKGSRISELTMALAEAKKRNWWILIDGWTPAPIRTVAMGVNKKVHIRPPTGEQDFFTYLHDIYLELWNTIVRE